MPLQVSDGIITTTRNLKFPKQVYFLACREDSDETLAKGMEDFFRHEAA